MLLTVLRYAWAMPNSLLAAPLIALCAVRGHVRVHDGVLEVCGPAASGFLRALPNHVAALTLGHIVIGRDAACLARTRRHERVHVRQYEVLGPLFLPAYALASALAWLRGGDPYRDNWFERQAYAAADCEPAPRS